MSEKPKLLWHATGNGLCHAECESWDMRGDHHGCKILDRLPWEVFDRPTPAKVSHCPFALLASVLCCGKETAVDPPAEPSDELVARCVRVARGCDAENGCYPKVRAVLKEAQRR